MNTLNQYLIEKLKLTKDSKLTELSDEKKINKIINNIIANKKRRYPKVNENKYFLIQLLYYDGGNNYKEDKDKILIFNSDYIFEYYTDTSNIEKVIYKLIYKLYGDEYGKALLCVYDENEHNVACGIAELNVITEKTIWGLEIIKQYNSYMYNKIKDTSSQS